MPKVRLCPVWDERYRSVVARPTDLTPSIVIGSALGASVGNYRRAKRHLHVLGPRTKTHRDASLRPTRRAAANGHQSQLSQPNRTGRAPAHQGHSIDRYNQYGGLRPVHDRLLPRRRRTASSRGVRREKRGSTRGDRFWIEERRPTDSRSRGLRLDLARPRRARTREIRVSRPRNAPGRGGDLDDRQRPLRAVSDATLLDR